MDNAEPTTCVNAIMQELSKPKITREGFFATFCNVFEPMQIKFDTSGFQPFKQAYLDSWLHTNQRVTIKDAQESVLTIIGTIVY